MITNEELQEMVKSALENWMFDNDPDGDIKRGLCFMLSGEWDQDVIDSRFEEGDKWDNLMVWASFLGSVHYA